MSVLPRICDQHASEAAFIWLLRDIATDQPNYALRHLDRIDSRVEAHLDGLRIAGPDGAALALEAAKENPEPGELFALAFCAFHTGDPALIDETFKLAAPAPPNHRAVASALGWIEPDAAKKHILTLFRRPATDPTGVAAHAIAIAAAAIHRFDPGAPVADAVASPDPVLRARSLRALGELGLNRFPTHLRDNLTHADFSVRASAAWSSVLLGVLGALPVLKHAALTPHPLQRRLATLAFRRLPQAEATAWRATLARDNKTMRVALLGAGAIGDSVAIPWLIDLMKTDALGRAAGEAFTTITGADLAKLDLERKPPADVDAGPTEDPEDPNVDMDPDGFLPWPSEPLVRKWWGDNAGKTPPGGGQRFLLGRPIADEAGLQLTLRDGFQRHRAAAALELALRKPGSPLFEVRARADRQKSALGV